VPGARLFSIAVSAALLAGVAPGRQAVPAPAPRPSHVVQPGESLWLISQRYGLTLNALVGANRLRATSVIVPGQVLVLPLRSLPAVTSVPTTAPRPPVPTSLPRPSVPTTVATTVPRPTPTAAPGVLPRLPDEVRGPAQLALVPLFRAAAAEFGVPPDLLMALAYQESRWRAGVVSRAGAIGVGQLLPTTATWVATELIRQPGLDPRNPQDNIRMSARFLRFLIDLMQGDLVRALAGYFEGPYGVLRVGVSTGGRRYADQVLARRPSFQP
jgi:soluble lytic murein transglycosylase-like protein